MKLGETGEYPQGKLNEADEGEIQIAIAADKSKGKVIVNFGKEVAWIGMNSAEAIGLGELLIHKAQELGTVLETVSGGGLDWDKALTHFRLIRNEYLKSTGTPGANPYFALANVFRPIAQRYYRGERTEALYRAMMAVE